MIVPMHANYEVTPEQIAHAALLARVRLALMARGQAVAIEHA